jgi:putative ABC transport system permease protein
LFQRGDGRKSKRLTMIAHDCRRALKALSRRPGLSFAIVLILALGIGSTTTIVSLTSSVLLSEIPYKEGDRLVVVKMRLEQDGSLLQSSYLDFESWQQQSRTLELMSVNSNYQGLNLTAGDRAERVGVGFVSSSYFDLLGIRPILGRTFRPEELSRTSPAAVTLLSHDLWQRRFGGDPAILGRDIQLQGLQFQVIGILPRDFHDIYQDIGVYVPVTMARLTQREGYIEDRAARWLAVFARLRPGVSLAQAQEEMRAISRRLAATFPDTDEGVVAGVYPLRTYQFDFDRMRLTVLTLLLGAAAVLLMASTSVTNLLLVRAVERRKEAALRLALGATRFHLLRQSVLEGAILCLAGAVLGVGMAFFAVALLARLGAQAYNLPDYVRFSVDLRALETAAALSLLLSLLSGGIPARESLKMNLHEELQPEGKGLSPSAGTSFTRNLLVVSAVFFSVVLLIGAGLATRSLMALIEIDPGFRVDRVLSARFELPVTQYRTDEPAFQLYRRILDRAGALPGVEHAGLWAPGMPGSSIFGQFAVPEGRSLEAPEDKLRFYEHRISPALLGKLGVPLLKGREFTAQDDAGHPRVAVLSRSMAETMWPSQNPLGKRFWLGAPHKVWVEVVGVAADVDQHGRLLPDYDFRRDIYFPLFQMRSRTASLLLATRREGGGIRQPLSRLLRTVAPDIPLYDVRTLRERRQDDEVGLRLNASLLIFFASSALALAVLGIYSILLYVARRQSHEIGIRLTLGAHPSAIRRRFVGRGLALLGLGLVAGLACAFGLAKGMSSILFKVNPRDPLVFAVVPCIIALVSLPAILRPAYWAAKADPSSLLRLQ